MVFEENPSTSPLESLKAIRATLDVRDLNEADTRHRIIDFILHDFLSWPKNRVNVEEYVASGYIDYVLTRSSGEPIILVEAKREGTFFTLPESDFDGSFGYLSLSKLLTDTNINRRRPKFVATAWTLAANLQASQMATSGFSSKYLSVIKSGPPSMHSSYEVLTSLSTIMCEHAILYRTGL